MHRLQSCIRLCFFVRRYYGSNCLWTLYGSRTAGRQKQTGGHAAMLIDTLTGSRAPAATILIRILVGGVFLSEGIQKFLFPNALAVGRFTKIGIPAAGTMAPFVGTVEIVFGAFILIGFGTRLSTMPLLVTISVAIATTKIPRLLDRGFWDARRTRLVPTFRCCLAYCFC